MQSQNRIFEDISKVASAALGTMAGVGREVETMARERMKEMLGGLDLVERAEFEAVREMAANARAEVEALRAEVAAMRAAATPAPAPVGPAPPLHPFPSADVAPDA